VICACANASEGTTSDNANVASVRIRLHIFAPPEPAGDLPLIVART
jgi:hypothetical protein